jgi:phospholipid-transporting ATPase
MVFEEEKNNSKSYKNPTSIELKDIKIMDDSGTVPRNKTKLEKEKNYSFHIDDNKENLTKKIKNNKISTTKYNIITFLPKALLFQFLRLANVYFLLSAILQCIPDISPLSPITAIVPITFVLSVSIIREGIEDYSRYNYDKLSNNEKVRVHREGEWNESKSGTLRVGEIIAVKEEEAFPADLILLDSSLAEGICYIETAQLDGEKTLKFKKSHNLVTDLFKDRNNKNKYVEKFKISGVCTCDPPSDLLYKLDGNIKLNLIIENNYQNYKKDIIEEEQNLNLAKSNISKKNKLNYKIENESMALDSKQLLLKGAILKNTEWIVGIVVYTGHSTKLMLNSKKGRVKFSSTEKLMSKYLIFILILQSIFCIFSSIIFGSVYFSTLRDNLILNIFVNNVIIDSIMDYFTYFLLLNTMIPISLIITMEITKVVQGFFISFDINLYSKLRDKYCKAGSVSLNEELGQIDYIFSDKTGTLTCNKMKFKYCVIADVCYEFLRKNELEIDESKLGKNELEEREFQNNFRREREIQTFTEDHLIKLKNSITSSNLDKSHYNFIIRSGKDESECLYLDNNLKIHEEFFKALSLNNECVVTDKKGHLEYSGLNPDDIELVSASGKIGCELMKSNSTKEKKLKIFNEEKIFEILNVIEFTSERKKSSIIVKDDDFIKLYIKGADSEMIPILHPETSSNFKEQSNEFIEFFSRQGYRTLMVGMKIFSKNEYEELNNRYTELSMSVDSDKQKKMDVLYKEFEKNIYLLGSTIVEDRLQDKVPETIRDLRLAGIKIWMLTGDKIDTAENIGKSCNLINNDLRLFKITNQPKYTFDDFLIKFEQFLEQKHLVIDDFKKNDENLPIFSILIDLKETKNDFLNKEKEKKFVEISKFAKSVICSRCSPGQKSDVVKMIKESDKNLITLSIGDGGNDVPMITEAHIGKNIYFIRFFLN